MRFLFLEPFFGGSHRNFAEGLIKYSRHHFDLLKLPARFWKWRMRGAALYFIKKARSMEEYQGVFATNLMGLADFKALAGTSCPPTLVYFHENQLTYPLAPGEAMDFQFGFTDITTALAADRVLFNTQTHFHAFFQALPGFLKMMPEYRPNWVLDEIRSKADVMYPGCQIPGTTATVKLAKAESPLLIIWNHRWEFDKNPQDFFDALDSILGKGLNFRLALLGENFQVLPKAFLAARQRFKDRIVQYGYEKSRRKYLAWLGQGAIVVSTAKQENFGISIIEAIRYGCIPLLPNRLSYPEIVPEAFHADFFYDNQKELIEKLSCLIMNYPQFQTKRERLSAAMGKYAWTHVIEQYDKTLETLATGGS